MPETTPSIRVWRNDKVGQRSAIRGEEFSFMLPDHSGGLWAKYPRGAPQWSSAAYDAAMSDPSARNRNTDSFFSWDGNTLVLNILGKPAASKDAIGKPRGNQLKVSVTAQPQDGRATDHMVRFLAPLFGVRVADIEVVFGRESIHKQLRIQAPTKLPAALTQLASGAPGTFRPQPAPIAP
jgi:uncharacterized protein